nr:unnamed protein product [Callosobruchus chinensis]
MYAQGYADDIVILIRGKHMGTCLEIMQRALSIVERWCVTEGLSVNPSKTIMVPFTKQRNAKITRAPIPFGNQIEVAREVKYLGINALTWCSLQSGLSPGELEHSTFFEVMGRNGSSNQRTAYALLPHQLSSLYQILGSVSSRPSARHTKNAIQFRTI